MAYKLILSVVFTSIVWPLPNVAAATYNVVGMGAKPDGISDTTQVFLRAWASACSSAQASTIYVPKGRYLLSRVDFKGPCKNKINMQIDGTIVGPANYHVIGDTGNWILFVKVDMLTVTGGNIDAKGAPFWACRKSGRKCPQGARSLTFNSANNLVVNGLTSINSQGAHIVINGCHNVLIRNVKIKAPAQSPNTDGIHVQTSTGVTITGADIKTGDDCISIGPGTRNLWMELIQCGPGHGVSIGSLAKESNEEGVQNVTLINSSFKGTGNGVRIKTWARPSNSFVKNIVFQDIVMKNVRNPVIIDQNYCPGNLGCPRQSSGVKISQVIYKNIRGTSATQIAVLFDCSASNPCRGIGLQDIKLTFPKKPALSSCKHIDGTVGGVIVPQSCF